jgi:hypothetical protein
MPCRATCFAVLLAAAFALGTGGATLAQELQLDPKALDTKALGAPGDGVGKPAKGRKGAKGGATAGQGASGTQAGGKVGGGAGGKTPDRQFGELEGWSPGKAPPGAKEEAAPSGGSGKSMPMSVSPSGNMAVGLPF